MRRILAAALAVSCLCLLTSCAGWRGLNSLPLPGTDTGAVRPGGEDVPERSHPELDPREGDQPAT